MIDSGVINASNKNERLLIDVKIISQIVALCLAIAAVPTSHSKTLSKI